MTNYNFVQIDTNKFNIDHDKLINFYFNIKNKKNLIKPIRKKIDSIDITNLSNNITKFNQIIDKIYYLINQNKSTKNIKNYIKNNFNTKNNLQTNIVYQIIKNTKQNYGNKKGGYIILDILGLIPILGLPIDILNTVLSLSSGNYFDALLSLAAAVPIAGTLPGLGKIGFKILKKIFGFSSIFGLLPGSNNQNDDDEDYDDEDE